MNLEAVKTLATSKFARQVLVTQKHSPKILFVAGVVGVVGATVLACRATLKISDVLDGHEKQKSDLDILYSETSPRESSEQRDQNKAKAFRKLQVRTALEIAKPYLPAVGLGLVSIAALTGSYIVLTKRNASVMAAYAAVQKGYDQYRERVRKELGDDKDRQFAHGAELQRVEEKLSNGKTAITDTKVVKDPQIGGSPYAVVFDERSKHFTREPGMNSSIVMMKQNYANDKLRAKGHLFLNEVYDMLGLPRTKAGAVVGWVYRNDNEAKTGDNYITFGVFEGDSEWVEKFIDGDEKYAVLDFNVDGVILDLI